MNPQWKNRLAAVGAALLAVMVGWWVAHGSYGEPLLFCAIAGAACVVWLSGLQFDAALLGGLLFGYIVGNRGFAQFFLFPGLPILPAEAGLAVCAAWLMVRAAWQKKLPVHRDALNFAVLLWMAIGSARIVPDTRAHGFLALRDFATIYYAAFFFVAQSLATNEASGLFLRRCLLTSVVVLMPAVELFRRFPDFFLGWLVVGGFPLIFFKGDLVGTFMAIGVVLCHRRWEASGRLGWLVGALGGFVGVLVTENRASLLGLLAAATWLALGRRTRLLRNLFVAAVIGGFGALFLHQTALLSMRENFVLGVYERAVSILDISGSREYVSQDVEFKGDNNRFRLVWWQAIVDETLASNPWLGLGFGHDMAAGFVRRYYADNDEEFTARSPHSIVVTIFGRMGLIGLAAFVLIVAEMARQTWRALYSSDADEARVTDWLPPWIILVSACFGVVLEGPMGAVVFWTSLGMAAGARRVQAVPTPVREGSLPAAAAPATAL